MELLIPIQLIYFTLSSVKSHSSYAFLLSSLKYSNGFNQLTPYDYSRSYMQDRGLVGINF